MLSKEQIEKRIAEIRKTPGAVLWPTGDRIELALNEAEALEELLSLREQLAVQKKHSADVLRVADSNGDCMLSWMLQYKEAEHKLNSVRQFIDDECFVIDPEDDENCIRAEYHSKYGELFTAAKPAED